MKNADLLKKQLFRETVISSIRGFFRKKNFREVETPLLVPAVIPESYLDVFQTELINEKGLKQKMFLTTSPEASIKKLLAEGIGNCFEITKSFRNNEAGSKHHLPEFTILEWYRIKADYHNLMDDCEELLLHLCSHIKNQKSKIKNNTIIYQNNKINFTPPWNRISLSDALKKYAYIDFDVITEKGNNLPLNKMFPVEKIAKIAEKKGYKVSKNNTWEEIFNQIFLNEIEPELSISKKPVILYDYPLVLSGLAKTKKYDNRLVERFEIYIKGIELADCYSELTDWRQQQQRFNYEMKLIQKKRKTSIVTDQQFIESLKKGLPQCSGIAMGIDRLIMLLSDAGSIAETIVFPLN